MVMVPPHMHWQVESWLRAGTPEMVTATDPGAQGAAVAGTHGIGVRTPRAADVAEATSGLASDEHIPKVGMLTIGAESVMVATGIEAAITMCGSGLRAAGATPKSHIISAPSVTMLMFGTSAGPAGRQPAGQTMVPPFSSEEKDARIARKYKVWCPVERVLNAC
jgi:hypothetical protein